MANRFGLTYSAQPEAPLSPRVFAILNNTYQDSPIMPLLGESIIHQKDKEEAAARKRDCEEREIAKPEKKAKAEYIKNGCGHQNLFNFSNQIPALQGPSQRPLNSLSLHLQL